MVPVGKDLASAQGSAHADLSRRFWAAIILVMACSLFLGLTLIARYRDDLEASRSDFASILVFRQALDAANRISAERGPTNSVLGEEVDADTPSRRRLASFRAESDAALDRIEASAAMARPLATLREKLVRARREVDALAERPLAARSNAEIQRAVETMFGVFDAAEPMLAVAITDLMGRGGNLAGKAMVARMLSELREHAGRLGSHLVIPMAHALPIDLERRAAFERTRGRVRALWEFAGLRTGSSQDAQVLAGHASVVQRFFGDGMALLDRTLKAGQTGDYGLTPTSFTDLIVPSFGPLEQLRDAFLDATVAQMQVERSAALNALILVAIATSLALAIEFILLAASQSLLFRPLLRARSHVLALAAGAVGQPIDGNGARGEMRSLVQALETLRLRLIERDAREHERAALTETLKRQADTDALTGILNRGAIERQAARLTTAAKRPARIGLILVDIDRFKSINDTYGHAAGDAILQSAVRRLRSALRRSDIIGRFGGEEFAILLTELHDEAPAEVAERLRLALESTPIEIDSGETISITASFGVAQGPTGPGAWPALLAAADRALYAAKAAGRNRVAEDRESV